MGRAARARAAISKRASGNTAGGTARHAPTCAEVLALRMAAKGCVSGRLREWPLLARVFARLGWSVPPTVGAQAMRVLARAALAQ